MVVASQSGGVLCDAHGRDNRKLPYVLIGGPLATVRSHRYLGEVIDCQLT